LQINNFGEVALVFVNLIIRLFKKICNFTGRITME
jgi:hypothetical protein